MLVVFQQHVVFGRVLADEVRLQNQRFGLAFGNNPFDVPDVGEHQRRRPVARMVGPVKVAPDTVLEHLGLADVDDFPLGVLHDIDARECRQFREPPLDMFAELEHYSENRKSPKNNAFFLSFCQNFIYLFMGMFPLDLRRKNEPGKSERSFTKG